MCKARKNYVCTIIPNHILKALAESKDRNVRESAMRAMLLSTQLRTRRSTLAELSLPLAAPHSGGKHRTIYNTKHLTTLPGQQVRDEGGAASSDHAVNEAYDGLGATYDLYKEVFNRDSIDDHGLPLVASVHYDNGFNNAFWNGQQMVFGDGDGTTFVGFTGAIDVIGHELTHGVVDKTCALEFHKQPGALNESFADVFGSLVKQHTKGQDAASADWLIGAGILAPGVHGVALRSMKDPGSAYDDPKLGGKDPQPKHMDDFVNLPDDQWDDWGGVHTNSGIPNHAFFLTATQIGGNAWEDPGAIWYSAMQQLWPLAQFQDCANVTVQVAGALFGSGSTQQQAVKEAWSEVGVPVTSPHAAAARRKKGGRTASVESNGSGLKKQFERLSQELRKAIEVMA